MRIHLADGVQHKRTPSK